MKRLVLSLIVFGLFTASAMAQGLKHPFSFTVNASVESPDFRMKKCKILTLFRTMWKDSLLGVAPNSVERAAWITLKDNGDYEFHPWQVMPKRMQIHWKGSLPAKIVALVHTHPRSVDPKPSSSDRVVAGKLQVYLYTISNKGIWLVTPEGMVTREADWHWYKKLFDEACK